MEYTAEDFHTVMTTNLESNYHMCQLAHPLLKSSGMGSIVFVSSVAGLVAISAGTLQAATKGHFFFLLPCNVLCRGTFFHFKVFAKLLSLDLFLSHAGAINQITKNLACEWAKDNIRTNAVAPWYIKTSLVEKVRFYVS